MLEIHFEAIQKEYCWQGKVKTKQAKLEIVGVRF